MTTEIRSLEQKLSDNLQWNKTRIKFTARFLIALYTARTVNLAKIATVFSGKAKEDSKYKQLQRFFRFFEMPYTEVATLVVKILGIEGPYVLALDRTNWKIGETHINLLVLSIVWQGFGFPVVWLVLPKAGNSDTAERIELMEIFIKHFGAYKIQRLLGDREFIGKEWFAFLRKHQIPFLMRIKKDTLVRNGHGKFVPAWRLFASTRINQTLVVPTARRMWGMDLFLSGCRLRGGEYLLLVSADYLDHPAHEYKRRWGIETLFGALKSRGFNLEDTRLEDGDRLSSLFALLAIAFTWAFVVGQWRAAVEGLKLTSKGYPRKSVFRLGLNMLCRLLTDREYPNPADWQRVTRLLSCT
jgi:Transposase DDE domain